MSDETKLLMTVPKDVIESQVRAAVAQVLAKDPERLVKVVVDAAMHEKKNSYDRTTIWEDNVNKMIRGVADAVLAAWIEEQKPNIESAIRAQLNKKSTCQDLAKSIVAKMSRVYCTLDLSDGDGSKKV